MQGSQRENGLVWTAQSSHSQVWSEVMNQTDHMGNGKRLDQVGLTKSSDIPCSNFGKWKKPSSSHDHARITSFTAMRLFTGMWFTMAITGKPNAYLTICINNWNVILKID